MGHPPELSIVVVGYNMARELPRTIRSLSVDIQREIDMNEYEIIVVDNGSTEPFDPASCLQWGDNISYYRMNEMTPSPVVAINHGLGLARGNLVGVMIDGARMVSPRLLRTALEAARLHHRPVIGTLAFHLGPDVQMRSVANGYNQSVEDELLESISWTEDAYRLFEIAVFAGSSAGGWFVLPAETNALFLVREHWQELGGYDPAFVSAGGGLVNLDTWERVCTDPAGRVIMLLGEATFHQVHGGVSTNAPVSRWPEFHEEYIRVRGHKYTRPQAVPVFVGCIHPAVFKSIQNSIREPLNTSIQGLSEHAK